MLCGKHWLVLLAVSFVLGAACGVRADTGLARHKSMFAVPVPGKVAIDGKLDDWNLSGQIEMYVISETKEMQSANFAIMYDKEAVYLGADIRDPSPMMNRHDPKVEGHLAWDADACQFRLAIDPSLGHPISFAPHGDKGSGKMAHLLLWYFTDLKKPCLQMHLGMDYTVPRPEWKPHGVVPNKLYKAVYRMAADKLGYTFEYRIPWAAFGMKKPYKADDLAAGTVQFNWSRPDGLKTAGGSAWAYDVMSAPGFPYQTTACWGKIIFSKSGNIPRDLVEEGVKPERPLPLTFTYDLPKDSEVTVTLFNQKNEAVRIITAQGKRLAGRVTERWDGLDEASRPLGAGTYTWRGLYHQPITTKFLFSAHNSGQPPHKTDDNTGGWGGDHGNPTSVCRTGKEMLLTWSICESGWGIIKVTENGKKIWGSKHNATLIATDGKRFFVYDGHGFNAAAGIKVMHLKDGRPLNWGNGHPLLVAPPGGDKDADRPTGLAYHQGIVYVSYGARNIVCLFDATSGDRKGTWQVPFPGRLAPRPDGSLAVISSGAVVSMKDGKSTPFLKAHLDDPEGIAVDENGRIYVANQGALQSVSVFDADGKYVTSIGKKGGRPRVGRYSKDGVLEPGGIAIDSQGRLWVAETLDGPRRHSVWDPKTGACVNEFFGGSAYFGWAYMDPKVPDELYCHNVIWKVNWKTNTCTPYSTIWRKTGPNVIEEPTPDGAGGHFRAMTAKNGKQFGWGQSDYSHKLYMRVGDVFKPIAGSIRVAFGQYGGGIRYPAMKDLHEKHKAPAYLWQDTNDDQQVQEGELTISPSNRGETTFNWIDEDLNVWCDAGFTFKPVRFEKDGRPVYDFSKRAAIPFRGRNANATSLYLDGQGGIYTLNPGVGSGGFTKYDSSWNVKWAYRHIVQWPKALSLPVVTPGELHGLTMPLGIAGDFTGAATYFSPYHIFTRDGLYVAMIMRDGRTGGLGPDVTASETEMGQLVKPDGMNRYFLLAGDQDGRVTEVLGLDTVKRLAGGTYTLTKEDADKAAKALAAYQQKLAAAQKLVIVRSKKALAAAESVKKEVDDKRAFAVSAAYDAKSLYFKYEVRSPFEVTNAAADPKLLFKGGNCLDIQLATDPGADPKRKKPAPGDLRVLVTRREGKAFAVVYRPKVKGFQGDPIVLKSPTGQESFDAIEATDRVGLEYQKTQGGFKAIVTLPLDLLGVSLKPGMSLPLDVGYIFGNKDGAQAALRKYWSNNSFSANVTYDIPNESRLEPHEWGKAFVE